VLLGHLLVLLHSDQFRLTVISKYWYIAQWVQAICSKFNKSERQRKYSQWRWACNAF